MSHLPTVMRNSWPFVCFRLIMREMSNFEMYSFGSVVRTVMIWLTAMYTGHHAGKHEMFQSEPILLMASCSQNESENGVGAGCHESLQVSIYIIAHLTVNTGLPSLGISQQLFFSLLISVPFKRVLQSLRKCVLPRFPQSFSLCHSQLPSSLFSIS